MRQQIQPSDVVICENENLKIPVLGHRQCRDFEIEKKQEIRYSSIVISHHDTNTTGRYLIHKSIIQLNHGTRQALAAPAVELAELCRGKV